MSFYDDYADDQPVKVHKPAKKGGGLTIEAREEANRRMDLITREMNRLDNERFKALSCDKPVIDEQLAFLQKQLQRLAVFLGGQ